MAEGEKAIAMPPACTTHTHTCAHIFGISISVRLEWRPKETAERHATQTDNTNVICINECKQVLMIISIFLYTMFDRLACVFSELYEGGRCSVN